MHRGARRALVSRDLRQRPVAAQVKVDDLLLVLGQKRSVAFEEGELASASLQGVKGHALTAYQEPYNAGELLTAFILVKSTREGLTRLGSELAGVEGVAEVYTVTGEWDFIAIVRVREHDDLAKVVTQHLTKLEGIQRTQTMVAFQQFSAHDLEAMFGLGMEDKKA
jgi:DNA-binding Lrp family transcriptional regulator